MRSPTKLRKLARSRLNYVGRVGSATVWGDPKHWMLLKRPGNRLRTYQSVMTASVDSITDAAEFVCCTQWEIAELITRYSVKGGQK